MVLDPPAESSSRSPVQDAMSSPPSSSQGSPARSRFEVEMFAHKLKTRLELASFKAIHGLGKVNIGDLEQNAELSTPSRAVAPLPWQPSRPVLAEKSPVPSPSQPAGHRRTTPPSPSKTLTSSQQSGPASSTTPSKAQRSFYADIFGRDFCLPPKPSSPATAAATPGTPSSHRQGVDQEQTSSSATRYTGTSSLLDKAASSPQLGSPERKNGRFDWHNNPSAEMEAREQELAASGHHFEMPSVSPTKRVRLASAAGALLASPRRVRMHSSGNGQVPSFLPNGHLASSLAQGLGISAPRTPRSRHNSSFGRQIAASAQPMDQDQEERDRVASALAMMAESRTAAKEGESSSGASSGDRPHTPPENGPRLLPQTPRKFGFADPVSITPVRAGSQRGHRRNVSWANPRDSISAADRRSSQPSTQARPKTPEPRAQDEDEGAAQYLLYLASSPSPAGASQTVARFQGATPSLHASSRRISSSSDSGDCPAHSQADHGDLVSTALLEDQGSPTKRKRDPEGHLPITPPPSGRTRHQRNPLELSGVTARPKTESVPFHDNEGHADTACSPPRTPTKSVIRLPAETGSDAEDPPPGLYGWGLEAPRTPPPLTQPHTPQAPGTDFSYTDFVNVSPSPKPRSIRRTPRTGSRADGSWTDSCGLDRAPISGSGADRTPSRGTASRARFLGACEEEWKSPEWSTTLTAGPSPHYAAHEDGDRGTTGRRSRTASAPSAKAGDGPARRLDFE